MKKWIQKLSVTMLAMFLLPVMLSTTAFAGDEIKVMVNGELVNFDVQPQVISSRTMVPLRAIFEKLGATVEWNNSTQTVTATKGDTVVVSTLGSKTMYINGEAKTMDVAPTALNGRTLVPARFVAEAFDCYVEWDGSSRTVYIDASYDAQEDDNASDGPGLGEGLTEDEIYDMYE